MTKSKSRKQAKKQQRRPRMVVPRNVALDPPALAYARLLSDPCNAPITHPIYPGTDAGFLFRAESFANIADPGAGAATTCGMIHWTPGYVNADNTEWIFTNNANPATTGSLIAAASTPGKAFLAANARAVRCIAACMKITFTGSESGRSGRLHYGHTNAGMLDLGQVTSVDQIAQTLQHYSRTPADTVEIIWKPNIADAQFVDPTATAVPALRDARASVTMAVAGLPTGTGMTVHFTAVYEWTPAVNLGVAHNALGKARSRNSLDDVQDYLVERGFSFVRSVAGQAGTALGAGIVAGISQTFGLMPTVPRRMAIRRF